MSVVDMKKYKIDLSDQLENHASEYSSVREILSNQVAELQAELNEVKQKRISKIKRLVANCADSQAKLTALVEANPAYFEKPRTVTLYGIKIGFQKDKGKVTIEDEAKTIKLIRDRVDPGQAELAIRIRESVHKPSVYDWTAADLKMVGISITNDTDKVVIKPVDGEVDKLVNQLLSEAERLSDEQE